MSCRAADQIEDYLAALPLLEGMAGDAHLMGLPALAGNVQVTFD